ncbi:MAG: helix-turn-helix transcriptional regulator [Haliea sp.]|nr:helix-turn-helix transcriptional regulator [Haliea sp.]
MIALIRETGFASATSTEIAKRAGVTWGAVQHHFGGKEEILEAVLERSHRAFQRRWPIACLPGYAGSAGREIRGCRLGNIIAATNTWRRWKSCWRCAAMRAPRNSGQWGTAARNTWRWDDASSMTVPPTSSACWRPFTSCTAC